MSGIWETPHESGETYMVLEVTQIGTTLTGLTTRVNLDLGQPYCHDWPWNVTGTIDPDSGTFSFTETHPHPENSDPVTNPCLDWQRFDGAFDNDVQISGTATAHYEAVWGSFEPQGICFGTANSGADTDGEQWVCHTREFRYFHDSEPRGRLRQQLAFRRSGRYGHAPDFDERLNLGWDGCLTWHCIRNRGEKRGTNDPFAIDLR